MRRKLTTVEEFFIDGHKDMTVDELAEIMPDVSEKTIADKLGEQPIINRKQPDFQRIKGRAVVMNEKYSELADEQLKKRSSTEIIPGKTVHIYKE
jgi:hypothetical protein